MTLENPLLLRGCTQNDGCSYLSELFLFSKNMGAQKFKFLINGVLVRGAIIQGCFLGGGFRNWAPKWPPKRHFRCPCSLFVVVMFVVFFCLDKSQFSGRCFFVLLSSIKEANPRNSNFSRFILSDSKALQK